MAKLVRKKSSGKSHLIFINISGFFGVISFLEAVGMD